MVSNSHSESTHWIYLLSRYIPNLFWIPNLQEVEREMTYWVLSEKPPSYLVDAWELLYEKFGTEPFSKEVAVDTLQREYPNLDRPSLGKLVDGFVEQGSLGMLEREF